MGNTQSFLQANGYTLVTEEKMTMLVKKGDDQFVIKKLTTKQDDVVSNFLISLSHPHIVRDEKIIKDSGCLYLVLEHLEGGDLSQAIKLKKEKKVAFHEMMTKSRDQTERLYTEDQRETMENTQILDWTVKICMALKHLHDQQLLHKNLKPKSIFFTACGTVRLGEFGTINEWSTDAHAAENKALSYVAPENFNGQPFDEKSEIWSLGCVVYEMCMLKCAFTGKSTVDVITGILTCSYEALPLRFCVNLHQLVKDTLQTNPENRPSVSNILMRPFIVKHLYKMSAQTIEELNESLNKLKILADDLEKVHFNTTVGSLTGGVVGLAGGITSVVGICLAPVTLGASLIVTGVGIGVAVAGGVTAGVSNVTKMVNQRSNRQNIKMLITELQEKITSTSCCIQNIQIALETQQSKFSENNESLPKAQSGANEWASAAARLGRGLGGITELVRLTQVASVGRVAAQTARAVRVAEAATGVLSGLFVAVDIFFVSLDSKEIHNLRQDYASKESQQESENATTNTESKSSQTQSKHKSEIELRSEIMRFVQKIRETIVELNKILDELKEELQNIQPQMEYLN